MKILYTISRYFVGGLFIFSGLIKINDPVGTQIKLEEYFEVFSSDFTSLFEYLVPFALILSVIFTRSDNNCVKFGESDFFGVGSRISLIFQIELSTLYLFEFSNMFLFLLRKSTQLAELR